MKFGRIWISFLIILSIVVSDQLTKYYIKKYLYLHQAISVVDGFFNLTHIRNTGAAFGLLAEASFSVRGLLFLLIPVIACVWLIVLIWQTRSDKFHLNVGYSLILGGAIGNLIDRFSLGYVVDFIQVYYRNWYFPSFNVADSAITVAAFILIFDLIIDWKKKKDDKAVQ